MGFDFADATALRTAREKFIDYLIDNGIETNHAHKEAGNLNHSWEFATYGFRDNGFTCVYCGIRRYHLPGQHDQCDHSITGECAVEDDPEARFGVDKTTMNFFNKTVDKWVKGADRESLEEVSEFFTNFKNMRNLSLSQLKKDMKDVSSTKEFLDKDIMIYRGGAITGDVINMTINERIAGRFAEKAGTKISAAAIKPKDIIGYLMRPNGELLVRREDLRRVAQKDFIVSRSAKAMPAQNQSAMINERAIGKSFMLHDMPPLRGLMDVRPGSPHIRIIEK